MASAASTARATVTGAWRGRIERWAFAVVWALLPLLAGPALATSLDPRSPGFRTAASLGLWLIWGATLAAALVPRTVTLTAIRIVAPAAVVATAWAAAASPDAGGADIVAVVAAAVASAVALAPGTGDVFANGSSYGHERRFPLRAPGALLLGPIEVAWVVAVAGAVTGPLLLASLQWIAGALLVVVGWPTSYAVVRMLHGLARRWLVFTPAGVVVHDPMVVLEAMLVLRRHLAYLGPAPAATTAHDLTLAAPGLALELDLTEPLPITPRPVRRPGRAAPPIESEIVNVVLVTPTRPGRVMVEAAERRFPVGSPI